MSKQTRQIICPDCGNTSNFRGLIITDKVSRTRSYLMKCKVCCKAAPISIGLFGDPIKEVGWIRWKKEKF